MLLWKLPQIISVQLQLLQAPCDHMAFRARVICQGSPPVCKTWHSVFTRYRPALISHSTVASPKSLAQVVPFLPCPFMLGEHGQLLKTRELFTT